MKLRRLFILGALVSLISGCASEGRLSIVPSNGKQVFTQSFTQAYSGQDEAGNYRILLVNDGITAGSSHTPLKPAAQPPVRQVVHIRLFWRPMLGSRANFPSSSNAAIDWYVMGVGSRQSIDMIHYRGVGFVEVHSAPGGVTLSIGHTLMQPAAACGDMSNPFGDVHLSGTLFAENNPERVKALWEQTVQSARVALSRAKLPAEASATAR